MEYQATFGIHCGVSHGFGIKYPDYVEEIKKISAPTSDAAFLNAVDCARQFADDYLSDPETGLTTVQLLELRGPKGNISFDPTKATVKCSWLEHILVRHSKIEDNP